MVLLLITEKERHWDQGHMGETDDVVDRLIDCVKSYKIVISSGGGIDAVRPKREPMTNLWLSNWIPLSGWIW